MLKITAKREEELQMGFQGTELQKTFTPKSIVFHTNIEVQKTITNPNNIVMEIKFVSNLRKLIVA